MRTPFLSLLTAALVGAGLCHSLGAQAQSCDLITNGNFEQRDIANISGNIANVFRPVPGSLDELPYWKSPNSNTSDYYSMGAPTTSSQSSNPTVAPFGKFVPIGEASLGILALQFVDKSWYYTEYATQPLAGGALAPGEYYASMKVYSASGGQFATNVGMNISENPPGNQGHYTPATGDRGIYSTGGMGASAWTRVSGTFVVDPGTNLRYLNVGNFEDLAAPTLDPVRPTAQWPYAYVYIDDVQLYKIPTAGPKRFCGGTSDQFLILGDGCGIPGASYAWYKGFGAVGPVIDTNFQTVVYPTTSSFYTLFVTLPDGTTSMSHTIVYACPPPSSRTAYPNPTTDVVTMPEGAQNGVLLNSAGKAVQSADATGQFDVRHLPAGLYNLQSMQGGKRVNQRIEVKH